MRLSNKLTFSLACLILILALAAMPAMAGKIKAEWTDDLDGTDSAATNPGWKVTVTFPEAVTTVTGGYLDPDAAASETALADTDFTAGTVAEKMQPFTVDVPAAPGAVVAVRIEVTAPTAEANKYQRVTFPEAKEDAELEEENLTLIPKLKAITDFIEYANGDDREVTVEFDFEMADEDEEDYGNPSDDLELHISDVTFAPDADIRSAEVSGTDTVTFTLAHADDAASESITVTLGGDYALEATQDGDAGNGTEGVATVIWDNMAPTATIGTNPVRAVSLSSDFAAPEVNADTVWDEAFYLTVSIEDETDGSGVDIKNSIVTASKLDVGAKGEAAKQGTDVDGTEYLIELTPKADRVTTAGEEVTITVTPVDKAGNAGTPVTHPVKLAEKTAPDPTDANFTKAVPASGNVVPGSTIMATFSKDPGATFKVSPAAAATVAGSGTTRTLTISSSQALGSLTLTLTWGGTTKVLTYNVIAAAPLTGLTVPAESYVIISKNSDVMGLPVSVTSAMRKTWAGMPDLEGLFYSGGTLALTITKKADSALFDHDGDDANAKDTAGKYTGKKADGTDGSAPRQYGARDLIITEIMAARNDAKVGTDEYTAHQWIEIYNPLKVEVSGATLAAKSGRPALDAASTEVLLDRFSNQVGVGWQFTGLGQNGFDDDMGEGAEFVAGRPNVDFVSFYRTERGKDGHTKGHWKTSTEVYLAGHKGTPGVKERSAAVTLGNPSTVPTSDNVIFNEIGNFADGSQWIEFKNRKGTTVNLKKWSVGIVTAVGTEVDLFDFPDKNINIPAGGVLLVTEKAFYEEGSQLGLGYDILAGAADQQPGIDDDVGNEDQPVRYMKQNMGNMPNGNFLLILRTSNDNKHLKTAGGGVQDIAGYYPNSSQRPDAANPTRTTDLWPFYRFSGPWPANNLTEGKVWRRNREGHHGHTGEKNEGGKHAWAHAGFTGGLGYKRATPSSNANGGTPGYANNALMGAGAAVTAPVYISEIMFADDGDRGRLPQWIEITNPSKSVGVNLHNWRITIVNHENTYADGESGDTATAEWDGKLEATFLLKGLMIQPNQSVIITSVRPLRKNVRLPNVDIFSVWDNSGGSGSRGATDMKAQGNAILNPYGFYITLHANGHEGDKNKWQSVDTVGNLAAPASDRRGNTQPVSPIAWMLPNSVDEDGTRSSIARTNLVMSKMAGGERVDGHTRELSDGTKKGGWILSVDDSRTGRINSGYYGHISDISSPGQTVGRPLPVSLSFFRPTLEDGKVVIRWTTESELDNAGFNILRSQDRNGEFTKVNDQLIQGKGTTAERSTYKWVDTSAKPGAVYYYQIEDVSFAGEHNTLTTTKMKGLISAKNKLTTKWGELKEVQ